MSLSREADRCGCNPFGRICKRSPKDFVLRRFLAIPGHTFRLLNIHTGHIFHERWLHLKGSANRQCLDTTGVFTIRWLRRPLPEAGNGCHEPDPIQPGPHTSAFRLADGAPINAAGSKFIPDLLSRMQFQFQCFSCKAGNLWLWRVLLHNRIMMKARCSFELRQSGVEPL